MKKIALAVAFTALATTVSAKTSFFGEADARVLLVNNTNGSHLAVTGYASDFGFKGEQAVSATEQAFFRVAYQMDLAGKNASPLINVGEIGLQGNYGTAAVRYGYTPLGRLNQVYHLISNSPLWNNDIFATALAATGSVPVGTLSENYLNYTSPSIADAITVDTALIPAEQAESQTGWSVAATYQANAMRLAAALELNAEYLDSSILRLNGDVTLGNLTVGGTFQRASNSATDNSASHLGAYGKMPLNIGNYKTSIQLNTSLNTLTNAANEKQSQFLTSFVQEIPFNSKVSIYSMVAVYLIDDLQTMVSMGGGGLKVRF